MKEVWMGSPHYSTSRGAYLKGAFHTTEGAQKIRDLGAWFQNPSAQCSSHHGSDNYERGVFGAYVYENYAAWTQGNMNGVCLSLEQCTPSGASSNWSRDTWMTKTILLDNAAEWMHYMAEKYGLPYKSLLGSEAQDTWTKGFTEHVEFGSKGSGHHDCGQFPMDVVLSKAKAWSGGGTPAPAEGNLLMSASSTTKTNGQQVYACVWTDGKVNVKFGKSGTWAACDPKQSPVKSGVDISTRADGGLVVTYTNGSGDVCTYEQGPDGGPWVWDSLEGNAK